MERDPRYSAIKPLISAGGITSFRDIFKFLPKSIIARDLGMNNVRFTKLMNNVDDFMIRDILRLAEFFEIDALTMYSLINQQYIEDKAKKKATKLNNSQ
jgi:hypothetical protein